MVCGLRDVTESTLQPRCIHVNYSKIQHTFLCIYSLALHVRYEALGWLIQVTNVYPIPILHLAYHLTFPTRVDGLGVCFVCIPKVSTFHQ